MADKIEFLVEETGAPVQEAELALALANFDMEDALMILQTRMRDVFVIKAKFLNSSPRLYGLMLFIANVSKQSTPNFRVRFVWSDVPYIYETNLRLHWYDFEKEIYRARLSERSHVALSQDMEKLMESRMIQHSGALALLKESCVSGDASAVQSWLSQLLLASGHFRICPKLAFEIEILNLREFKGSPSVPSEFQNLKKFSNSADIFVTLPIALANPQNVEEKAEAAEYRDVASLKAGDSVYVYILDNRDSSMFLTELFGGINDNGLMPVEAPVESVWQEGDLHGVRVRFGKNVVGEGTFPKTLEVSAMRRQEQGGSFLSRLLGLR